MTKTNSQGGHRGIVLGIVLVAGMVLLVALAVGAQRPGLVLLLLLAVAGAVGSVRAAVPAVPLLWITFGICTPLYTAIYATALTTLFGQVAPLTAYGAYLLPLATFIGALFWRRAAIATRLTPTRAGHKPALTRGLVWLALSFAVGSSARAVLPAQAPYPSA